MIVQKAKICDVCKSKIANFKCIVCESDVCIDDANQPSFRIMREFLISLFLEPLYHDAKPGTIVICKECSTKIQEGLNKMSLDLKDNTIIEIIKAIVENLSVEKL